MPSWHAIRTGPIRLQTTGEIARCFQAARAVGEPVMMARIACVRLDLLRHRYGETRRKWAANLVERRMIASVERGLGPADLFMRARDGSYVVLFADIEAMQAGRIARAIAAEINSDLVDNPHLPDVRVVAAVADDRAMGGGDDAAAGVAIAALLARAQQGWVGVG